MWKGGMGSELKDVQNTQIPATVVSDIKAEYPWHKLAPAVGLTEKEENVMRLYNWSKTFKFLTEKHQMGFVPCCIAHSSLWFHGVIWRQAE